MKTIGIGIGLATIVILIAMPTQAAVTYGYTAPYSGSVHAYGKHLDQNSGCGASSKIWNFGSFNRKTGNASANIETIVAKCGTNSYSLDTQKHGIGIFNISYTPSVSGYYNVSAQWSYNITNIFYSNSSNGVSHTVVWFYSGPSDAQIIMSMFYNSNGTMNHSFVNRTLHMTYMYYMTAGTSYGLCAWFHYQVDSRNAVDGTVVSNYFLINAKLQYMSVR